MNETTTHPTERRVRRAHLTATAGVTAVAGATLLGTVLLWADDLPGRLATHFDLSGVSDDSMTTGLALTFFALVAIGLPVVLIAVFAALEWWRGEAARAFAGLLAALPVGLTTVFVAVLQANRTADGPGQATLSPWLLLLALGLAVLVGLLVALVLPRGLPRAVAEPVTPVALTPGERASWFGRVQTGKGPMWALGAGVLVLAVAALATGTWWLWLLVPLIAVVVLAATSFVVTVDSSGVTWRSTLGLPRGHVPLARITGAAVIDVSPADFGGFGLRMTPTALGLITRQGTALQVTHGSRRLVATVDDAITGAGLLQGLLDTRHTAG